MRVIPTLPFRGAARVAWDAIRRAPRRTARSDLLGRRQGVKHETAFQVTLSGQSHLNMNASVRMA
jgi:hypothetical protein